MDQPKKEIKKLSWEERETLILEAKYTVERALSVCNDQAMLSYSAILSNVFTGLLKLIYKAQNEERQNAE